MSRQYSLDLLITLSSNHFTRGKFASKCDIASGWYRICYDDDCLLRKYARSVKHSTASPAAATLANVQIVMDALHMWGHTDKWCAENCDLHRFEKLNDVSRMYNIQAAIHNV